MKNYCYRIPDGEHAGEVLWSGRYACVVAFIFMKKGDDLFVLANQRGQGTPDFQGLWNCPCGFIEADETGEECCLRETIEECGYKFDASQLILHSVETDPKESNKAHVTLRYFGLFKENELIKTKREGGEENEVDDIKLINIKDISKYDWAFNHQERINDVYNTLKMFGLI